MSEQLAAAAAIFHRDLRIFLSYRSLIYSQALSVVASLAIFYYVSRLLDVESFTTADEYFAFVVVGLVIVSVVQATLVLAGAIQAELLTGTFERVLLSPFGAVRGALSMMIFPTIQAFAMGTWTLLVAAVLFGSDLQWATVPLAIPVGILAALTFSSLALLIAALIVVFKQAPGMGLLITGIALISGFYFPTELLPSWIQWASDVQPFTPAVELLRHLLMGLPMKHSAWILLVRLIAFAAVLLPLGTWVFARGIAMGQRKGTIIEY